MKKKAKEQGNTYITTSDIFQTVLYTIMKLVPSHVLKRTMLKRMYIDIMGHFTPQIMTKFRPY